MNLNGTPSSADHFRMDLCGARSTEAETAPYVYYRFGIDRTLRGESFTFSMKSGVSAMITELLCAEMAFQISAENPSSHDAAPGLCIAVFHASKHSLPNTRDCHFQRAQHTELVTTGSGMAFTRVYCHAECEVM
jgi:hypothetical protein